jgi:hypothetical protein
MEGIIKLDIASVYVYVWCVCVCVYMCVYYILVQQKITFKDQLDYNMARLMEPA